VTWAICRHPCPQAHKHKKPSHDWAISIQSPEGLEIDVHGANVAMLPRRTKKRWLIVPNLAACNISKPSLLSDSLFMYVGFPARQDYAVIKVPWN